MVTELCSYPFSSYPASIGQVKAPNQILRKGAKKNTARDVAIYLARERSGESGVDLGKYFAAYAVQRYRSGICKFQSRSAETGD